MGHFPFMGHFPCQKISKHGLSAPHAINHKIKSTQIFIFLLLIVETWYFPRLWRQLIHSRTGYIINLALGNPGPFPKVADDKAKDCWKFPSIKYKKFRLWRLSTPHTNLRMTRMFTDVTSIWVFFEYECYIKIHFFVTSNFATECLIHFFWVFKLSRSPAKKWFHYFLCHTYRSDPHHQQDFPWCTRSKFWDFLANFINLAKRHSTMPNFIVFLKSLLPF